MSGARIGVVTGGRVWKAVLVALATLAAGSQTLSAQREVPPDKVAVADAVRADLSRLSDLERAYFAKNKRYTTDVKALQFTPASGALIGVSYASARTFSASAAHVRLEPFLCFVIVSNGDAGSPAEKPFCTDSRYGTAASALARSGMELDSSPPAPLSESKPVRKANVTPVTIGTGTHGDSPRPENIERPAPALTAADFPQRLRTAVRSPGDSVTIVVQFAVKDARYDPSRELLEIAVDPVPLPLAASQAPSAGPARLALACFTRPAFVCGPSGLSYIARDLLHVPRSRAPDPETLRSGLILQARFGLGRRDDTTGPALTLLALVLQAKGEVVSRWDAPSGH